ncbi:hypothetical protein AB0M36_18820 [Actinoplanes sp. NPDC051346]|uniref:hypothetical protein n=1 Tax=Actinoplanes sp. NPDC051346 TaxID=3155048 RepID=UPI0034369E50
MGHSVQIFAGVWTRDYHLRPPLPAPAAAIAVADALRCAGLDIVVGAPEDADTEPFDEMVAQSDHLFVEVTIVEHPDGVAGFELEATANADGREGTAVTAYLTMLNRLLPAADALGAVVWDDDTGELITPDTVAATAEAL